MRVKGEDWNEKKRGNYQKIRTSLAANIIGAIVLLLLLLGFIVSFVGFAGFTRIYKMKMAETTYHMADTASSFVNGNHLDAYLAGEETEEYQQTKGYLDNFCQRMNVSLVYVLMVDTSDYGRFVSVFNAVNNSVDNTEYTEWELGYSRDTTNDEYKEKYQDIYEQKAPYATVYRIRAVDVQNSHITTIVPVKNAEGEVAGILCIQRPSREIYDAMRSYLLNIAQITAMMALLASVSAANIIRRQFVWPIKTVAEEAKRFARENTRGENLSGISQYRELSDLADSINTMEIDMVNYIENLTAITAERERIGAELSLATRIQAAMLPHVFPPFPDRAEIDIYASMNPAKEVGGDFYDFFFIDDDHLCMIIADVSGKGIPAALFMMASKIILQSCAMLGNSAADILTRTNEAICSKNPEEMFITVWLGILEISTGKLTAANAGHEYPVLRRANGVFELQKDRHGLVLGAMDGIKYRDYELQLHPGDKLFVYTDGVPEATDAENRLFGIERMLDALNEAPDETPKQLLRNIRIAVDSFVKEAEQFDDLTMLCMEYKGTTRTLET